MHPAVAACEGVIVQSQSESESESQAAVTQRRVTTVWAAEWPSCCCLLQLQVHLCVLHFSLMTFYLFFPLSPGLCGCQNCAYATLRPSSESNCLSACLPATYSFCLDIFMQLAAEIVHIVFYASLICKQRATEPFTASANFCCPILFGGQGTRLNHSMRASSASNSAFIECTNPISSKLFGGSILKPKVSSNT